MKQTIKLAKSEWRSGLVQQQLKWRRLKFLKSIGFFLEISLVVS
jgi:hypothetical protein